MTRRALLSVSNKTGLIPFAAELVGLGFELISTGGTRLALLQAGIPVIDISQYTGFPEMMDGRVKTLHPRVHGGLLGRPDKPEDQAVMSAHGITPFELVVVNLYPFVETISREGVTREEAIEQIDIGGPSMLRSAAKNHQYVSVVTSPDQYEAVMNALREGPVPLSLRRQLAAAVFEMTARYDRAIADYMSQQVAQEAPESQPTAASQAEFPSVLSLKFSLRQSLRYGENPHQRAAFYVEDDAPSASLARISIRHGKELSYNNLLDLDAALQIVREFSQPAATVIKHNNPCGCAVHEQLAEAYEAADAGDPVSAFGSIIGLNRSLDLATARRLCEPGRFIEAIIAPGYDADAFEHLTTVPRWKASVRLVECPALNQSRPPMLDYRRVSGGLLVQDRDDVPTNPAEWKVVTERQPTDAELRDLEFAWTVCKHVKSNAVLLARAGAVVGVGAGQMSRLDSTWIACHKAGERTQGAVCASDAFFPFRDGIDQLAKAGIKAVVQAGGSKRDDEVIAACNEHGMAMLMAGRRHFRH